MKDSRAKVKAALKNHKIIQGKIKTMQAELSLLGKSVAYCGDYSPKVGSCRPKSSPVERAVEKMEARKRDIFFELGKLETVALKVENALDVLDMKDREIIERLYINNERPWAVSETFHVSERWLRERAGRILDTMAIFFS